jgi:hypothetical protein
MSGNVLNRFLQPFLDQSSVAGKPFALRGILSVSGICPSFHDQDGRVCGRTWLGEGHSVAAIFSGGGLCDEAE